MIRDALRHLLGRPPRSREALLKLLTLQTSEQKVRTIGDQMILDRFGGFDAPHKILCILFASRAGSGYCGRLLSRTPYFNYVAEAFRPKHLEEVRERFGFPTHHEAAQWMIADWGSEHAYGFKAGLNVLIGAAYIGLLPEVLDRTQFILLRRRDKVGQAVSLLKGKLSGRMHSVQPDGRTVGVDEYDSEAIARNISHIARNERILQTIVLRFGKRAPMVCYEDVCAAPAAFVERICGMLDLPFPEQFDPEVDLEVLRDEVSAQWTARFRAEHLGAA